MFGRKSLNIFTNKKLVIAIIAVIFVPILYAGMFLWAFWDPYDHLEDVPVAIVNEDVGYDYNDEHLTLGNELVDKLKEEAAFDFHFVDRETGYEGLNNEAYYILIEIPENFSRNSTTVMDDTPQKVELIYVPNESFNFLASQMGETAMMQIEMTLEEKITETYAETIFDTIDEVAEGLVTASDATNELNEGAHELEDGSKQIRDNLNTLANKMLEFTDGVETAQSGTRALVDGTDTLSAGIDELYENSNKLFAASEELQTGAHQLATGISDVDQGIQIFKDKMPELINGTEHVQNGLQQFYDELPTAMSEKVSETVLREKDPLRERIEHLLDQKKSELAPTISNRLADEIATGASQGVVDGANKIIKNAPEKIATNVAKEITDMIKNKTESNQLKIINDIQEIMQKANVPDETVDEVIQKLETYALNYDEIEQFIKNKLETGLSSILQDVTITSEQQKQLEKIIKEKAQTKVEAGVNEALDSATGRVDDAFDDYEELLLEKLENVSTGLETQIKQALDEPIGQLQAGLTQINDGQSSLLAGIDQLADGTTELKSGSQQLSTGQSDYVKNMDTFTSSFAQANNGALELFNGTNELFTGMFDLKDGSIQLSDGTQQLFDGSDELHDGMLTLVEGTEEFKDEMQVAADEANDVHTTEDTHQMIANPVKVENEKINEVPNYGTGFSPYFLSLGLFVGALLLSIVYPLREPAATPTNGTNWFFRKFTVLFIIGVLQAFIASGILLIGLGLEVQSVPLFILFAVITSLVFITLIQFLVTCFDDPGRFVAILILILQLTTSAGTFPLELIPKALQPFNALLPMTYSVAGFKAVVSSGNYNVMWQNAGILIGFSIIFMLLTLIYFNIKYKKTYGNLENNKQTLES